MVVPESLTVAATAITATNNSISALKAIGNLTNGSRLIQSSKATEIRGWSLLHSVLPKDYIIQDHKVVGVPLMSMLVRSYRKFTVGDTHVVFSRSSIGKTTACVSFVNYAQALNCQALMITGAPKGTPYLSWMAQKLDTSEENVLADLVAGMKTVDPSPASILVLDELNEVGADNCNIMMVDALMRFIYTAKQRINLYVVTQNEEVADKLCRLNEWQKIGPMDGLTSPSRKDVASNIETLPSADEKIPWNAEALEWTAEQLTKLIKSRDELKEYGFEMSDDGKIEWLHDGMTPLAALKRAGDIMEEKDIEKMTADFQKSMI